MKKTIGWIISILIAIVVYNFAGRGVQGIIWMLLVGVPLLFASEFYLSEDTKTNGKNKEENSEISEDEIDELLEDI